MAYARVVVDVGPAHLDRLFDYRLPDDADVGVGSRLRVRFNGRPRVAWVTDVVDEPATDPSKVKQVDRIDGAVRWFDPRDLTVWRWVADRYAGTMSGTIRHALPPRVVRVETEAAGWGRPGGVPGLPSVGPGRVPGSPVGGSARSRAPWVGTSGLDVPLDGQAHHLRAPLHPLAGEGSLLADLVSRCVAGGRQALVIVPSPAPGPADDVLAAAGPSAADLRGAQTDADRYRVFLRARRGDIAVIVGERGVALMPLPTLGLIVVVDEASPAYKEQRSPRHHVREAVLARARITGATAVLTSSVLSAQARRHVVGGHLALVRADRATERAHAPDVQVIDRTALPPSARRTRLVGPVSTAMGVTLADGGLVIVLAAAKGSGTSLACTNCRSRLECRTCGGGVAPVGHRNGGPHGAAGEREQWLCAACGWDGPSFPCMDCDSAETFPLRAGAGRFAAELARAHPEAQVMHMEGFDQPGPDRRPAIAVMTRGSVVHRPDWLDAAPSPSDRTGPRLQARQAPSTTPGEGASRDGLADLLVIADPDVLLGRPDVEAAEDALRLWLDAARLARRIIVQTAHPTDPALQALVRLDPDGFWTGEHRRRAELGFPPAGSLVRFTSLPDDAAATVRRDVPGMLLGPDPAGAALLKTDDLRGTLKALTPLRRQWALDDRRIHVDVDPVGTV